MSDVIPELYRELVPSRTTHADFFKRLFYHRHRLNQVVRTKMQELVMDEEETRWEDDSVGDEAGPSVPPPAETPVAATNNNDEQLRAEVEHYKQEMAKLQARVAQLEKALTVSEAQRAKLETMLDERENAELPHKKAPVAPTGKAAVAAPVEEAEAVAEDEASEPELEKKTEVKMPSTPPSTSWEALPISPKSSSTDEPVVVLSKQEEDEEDDWE